MKTIGLIGGLAWPSTAEYYQKINELVARRLGGSHCAKMVIVQTDFDLIQTYQQEDHWDRVAGHLIELGCDLKRAGADFFLIACNTVHIVAEQVEAGVGLPFIHIADPTGEHLKAQGYRTVGLLGSRYTMRADFFTGRLRDRYGLRVLIAEGAHQDNVHRALYEELARGIFTEATRVQFKAAIADLAQRGAEGIILGCTEFGLLVHPEDSPVPLVDTTVMHVEAAVEAALK